MCSGGRKKGGTEPGEEALGRSRGGFSTKLHLVCDGLGHPLHFELSGGQTHEWVVFEKLVGSPRVPQGEGGKRAWPEKLAGDKAYRVKRILWWLGARGIVGVIPEKGAKAHEAEQVGI